MSIVVISSAQHQFSQDERFELFEIMRDAYARTEIEIWGENYLRMPQDEFESLINEGRIIGAKLGDKIVGSIYSRNIDSESSTFGLLGVHRDFGGLGIGTALVESVEERAKKEGFTFMNLDILRPRDFKVPVKDRLKKWYEGMDYVFSHHQDFQDRRPDRAKHLKVPSVFDCYQKKLRR